MVRLFAALRLAAGVHAALAGRQADLRSGPLGSLGGVRWTAPDQWHLTLAFYGDVTDDVAARLAERLARVAARSRAPEPDLGAGGTFGSVRRGQVLTVAVVDRAVVDRAGGDGAGGDGAGVTPLVRLAERCRAAGRREGLAQPARPYRPHVTLARGRPGVDLAALAAAFAPSPGPARAATLRPAADPGELLLVRSRLGAGPGGRPEHAPVGRWPLAGHD